MSRLKVGDAAPPRGVPERHPHRLARRSAASALGIWALGVVGIWSLGFGIFFSYRAGSVPVGGIGCGFKSAFVIPSDHLIASRYICCTSRMSQVVDACANEP